MSRAAISETLFSRGSTGTRRDLPQKVERFDAARAAGEVLAIEDSIKRCGTAAAAACFTALHAQPFQTKAAACRWRTSFEAAQGRPPSAGDMVGDAHVVQMLEKRRRLQGKRLARAGCAHNRTLTRVGRSEARSSKQARMRAGAARGRAHTPPWQAAQQRMHDIAYACCTRMRSCACFQ